jgi:uncharacterized protein YoxC
MDPGYIEILDTNKELRKELANEIADNDSREKKIASLYKELESCYNTISHHDSLIIAHEEEIASLKTEITSLKQRLRKALQDVEQKEKHLLSREDQMHELEDKVNQLKLRIRELANKKNILIKSVSTDMNNALEGVLDNRERTSACLARIRLYLDERGVILPDFVRIEFDNIATALFEIIRFARAVEGHWENRGNLLEQQTQRATEAERRLTRTRIQAYQDNQALNDERRAHQHSNARIFDLRRTVYRNVRERCKWRRRYETCAQQAQNLKRYYRNGRADIGLLEYNRDRIYDRYLKWKAKELNSRQIILNLQNNPPNMATMVDVNQLLTPAFTALPFYDGQEEPDSYYAKLRNINETARPLAVAGFNALARSNKMREKMTGRFHPVPVNNPYNGNNPINNEPEFQNWLQGKYQEVMVGTNRDALRALMSERFSAMDTSDTYEKRIKPYVQGIPYAEVLPYLYEHMPQYMEMRLRQANPANLDAFFTDLRRIWLESRGRIAEQPATPSLSKTLSTSLPQKDDFKTRLARDLSYAGIEMDDATLEKFIYDELKRRLGGTTAHVRKSPFAPRSINATKKVIRKVVPCKAPIGKTTSKIIRHCSACGKAGHTKVNCPRLKRTKKVNYVYQDEVEDPENSEEEYIVEEEDSSQEEEIEDDDVEYVEEDDSESRNCYAVKKKWYEAEYL